jgi:restriction system protein
VAIPDYQTVMLPLLQLAADGKEHRLRDVVDGLADDFGLSDEERKQLLPSGRRATFVDRVGWARTYMQQAGLLKAPSRGYFKITDRGLQMLEQNPEVINDKLLEQYQEFRDFKAKSKTKSASGKLAPVATTLKQTPQEIMEDAYATIRSSLASDLIEQIMQSSPSFFERLVLDLLVKMGYGGTRQEAAEAVGGSGDEGIDGIIHEDRLGLETLYIQAKRWQNTVGRPEIQRFVGALHGKNARKGVFITTSDFTKEASDYAKALQDKVILINSEMLADLMIDYGVGVAGGQVYEIKRMDSDYFNEE